ncbi:MAG: [protein-PII] uridylyltransferase [Granulosicoccus sp.]
MTDNGASISASQKALLVDPAFQPLKNALRKQTDDLIDAAQPAEPGIFRTALNDGHEFIHQQFLSGSSAYTLLALRTELLDNILTRMWQQSASIFAGLSLLAVGGYGRRELHPHSDIDIAILLPDDHNDTRDAERNEALSQWVTALWDLNLDIGHSVRTVSDCVREASADITVITNLMEARLICGDETLFDQMKQITSPSQMWSPEEFFHAKVAEQQERYSRFQTNAYRLEPNIKESQGGLRDFQTISWICQRVFGSRSLEPLVARGLLVPEELHNLREGLEHLWKIRYLLHRVAGRREDRLLFDYQKEIAHAFGYLDDTDNRSIETLMQQFYRNVMVLQRLNEILIQGIGGIISGVTAKSTVEPINARFQLRNGYLEVTHDDVFMHYPPALLELFLIFGTTPEATNVRSHTVRLIRANLPLINSRFRSDPVVKNLFIEIFSIPDKLTRTIRLMNRYGVIAAYIPAFDQIVGRMQYDLFHIYTVDEHTLKVIRNCRRLALPQFADELPHGSEVAATLSRPHILYLTALFHDIAKGRGGDHSELGAEDAKKFAEQHGLCSQDRELMEWTVRHHLMMSITAQRKDIDDPKEQLEFARKVGSIEHLNHLYLLTISDIRATNPELWNSFKQSLLQSLYRHTFLILKRGLDNPMEEGDVIARRQAHTLTLMDDALVNDSRVAKLWKTLGDDYFRQYQAIEIARHTEILLANENSSGPLVSLRYSASRGSTEILIYTPDNEALFALIAAVLERLQLSVFSATINTTDAGYALDTFHVLDTTQLPIEDPSRIDEIRYTLTYELGVPRDIPSLGVQPTARRLRYFSISTIVEFSRHETGLSEVRITAADRPGILSSIARVFLNAKVNVLAARISTLGERIDDVFLVCDSERRPLDADGQKSIRSLLEDQL